MSLERQEIDFERALEFVPAHRRIALDHASFQILAILGKSQSEVITNPVSFKLLARLTDSVREASMPLFKSVS